MTRRGLDQGSTLFEVVIAVVILGLVSFSFLNAASSNTKVEKIDTNKTQEQIALSSAAQLISGVPYELCNQYKPTPYSTYQSQFPDNVKIMSIQGRTANRQWKSCADPIWTIENAIDSRGVLLDTSAPIALSQLIELAYCEPISDTSLGSRDCGAGRVVKATSFVSKTYRGSEGSDYKVLTPSYVYQGGSTQTDACGLWWGGDLKVNFNTVFKDGSTASNYRYFILQPGPPNGLTTSISGSQLSISAPNTQGSLPSRITFEVGAFNEQSAMYAKPASVSLQMWPPLTYKADYAAPKVVPGFPASLPIVASGGGEQGTFSFSVGDTPSSFTFTGTSGTSSNLTWTTSPTPTLGSGGNSRTEQVPLKIKWSCWPALVIPPSYPVTFRPQLNPGIKNGVLIAYSRTCTAFRTTPCSMTLTRYKDYGTGEITGSGQNWYLNSYSLFRLVSGVETAISGSISVSPALATTISGDEATQTLSYLSANGNPCRSTPDNNTYRVKLNFVDTYYGQLRQSNATIVVDFTC